MTRRVTSEAGMLKVWCPESQVKEGFQGGSKQVCPILLICQGREA